MNTPGEYADYLRAVGRFLDEQDAQHFEIIDQETFLAICWQTTSGINASRGYCEPDVDELRQQTWRLRSERSGATRRLWTERLRTVGQQIDSNGLMVTSLVGDRGGIRVSGVSDGRYLNRWYGPDELSSVSKHLRARRRAAVPQTTF